MLFLSQGGLEQLLDVLAAQFNSANVLVRTFKNDYSPSFATVLSDFTESDFEGYAAVGVSLWSFTGFAGHIGYIASADGCDYLVTGGAGPPQLLFGYYVCDAGGNLLWGERDPDGPVSMTSTGNSYRVYPRLGLSNCPP